MEETGPGHAFEGVVYVVVDIERYIVARQPKDWVVVKKWVASEVELESTLGDRRDTVGPEFRRTAGYQVLPLVGIETLESTVQQSLALAVVFGPVQWVDIVVELGS